MNVTSVLTMVLVVEKLCRQYFSQVSCLICNYYYCYSMIIVPQAVNIITFERTSPTVIYIKWSPLTLEQSMGFITHYTVIYYVESVDGCTAVDENNQLNISSTSETLSGLYPAQRYCISIAAYTKIGLGDLSNIIVPSKFSQ